MNNELITTDGLLCLARIFVSCKPIMGEILKPNQLYLIGKAKEGQDVDFDEFVANLPLPDPTYQQIIDFAKSIGCNEINSDVASRFFGGIPHFEKILGQVKDPKFNLKNDFAQRIFFAHILLPVKILSVEPKISAIYQNKELQVVIDNLVTIDKSQLKIGGLVLVHYASVISANPKFELVRDLLDIQHSHQEFVEASNYVKRLDYQNFWNLCSWTEETLKDRQL